MDQTEVKFIKYLKNQSWCSAADSILVAVSGGSDSMALLTLLTNLPLEMRPLIHVATVDFALRPESSAEVQLVRDFCQGHNLEFHTTVWQHEDKLTAMEQKAREFRYDFFARLMKQFKLPTLVVAHQGVDQAETVLMKLVRSGSLWESGAMKSSRAFAGGKLVRPLLNFSKAELIAYLERKQVDFAVDQTNYEDITWRNRLRNKVMPQLEKENPQLVPHLVHFANQQQAVINLLYNYFAELSQKAVIFADKRVQINLQELPELDFEQLSLFIQYTLHQYLQLDLTRQQLQQLKAVLVNNKANANLDLEDDWQLNKSYNSLIIQKVQKNKVFAPLFLKLDETYFANNQQKFKIKKSSVINKRSFYFGHMPQTICLRHRQTGDVLLLNNGHHQKLKDRLINQKIPRSKRNQLWVLTFDDEIVWVEGVYRYQSLPTKYLFEIQIGD